MLFPLRFRSARTALNISLCFGPLTPRLRVNASSNESVFGSHPGSSGESGDDAVSSSTGDGGGSGSGLGSGSNSNDAACVEVGAGGVSASPDIGGLLCIG